MRPRSRVVVVWLLTAAALHLMNAILPGFEIDGDGTAILAAALIGLVNALVWPLLIRVALPFTVLTLGLGVLVLNGAVILLVAQIEPSMHVRDLGTGIAVAIGVTDREHPCHRAARDRRRRLLLPQRPQARSPPPGTPRRTPTCPASTSSRSTGSPTT